jgi:glycosyltransferase involved in cell wall biosynthesis
MPRVSVLIANYNKEAFIGEALESILGQTFTDFECIIVDDCSTDTSWDIIRKYASQDPRIACYQNTHNIWISLTRNRLLDFAQGEYIAWLDSDDRAHSDRLEKQVQFLDTHPHHGIVGSWISLINSEWRLTWTKELPVDDTEIRKQWYVRNSLNQTSLMMRKRCIEKTGYYNMNMDPAEDYDFYVRAGAHCLLANIPENLTHYRIHTENTSLRQHRKTIQKTLLIRKKMRQLGYTIGLLWYLAYPLTWCMQFVPPKLSLFLFHTFIKAFSQKNTEEK